MEVRLICNSILISLLKIVTYPEQDSIDEIEDIKYDLGLSLSHDHLWLACTRDS